MLSIFGVPLYCILSKYSVVPVISGKLDMYGMELPALDLLSSYLTNRNQMCSVNGVLSGLYLAQPKTDHRS